MKQTNVWKFFSSVKLAIWLLAIIAVVSLIGTFIAQNEEPAFYITRYGQYGYSALLKTGLTNLYGSWWFILLLISLSLNLTVCLLNRLSLKGRQLGTLICHISILVILLGALIGMLFGQKGYVKINKAQEAGAFETDRGQVNLGFSVRLDDFIYNENIDPKEKLLVYPHTQEGPDLKTSSSFGVGVLAEIPTEIGSEREIANTGYKVRILRYMPDFVMDTSTKEVSNRSAKANNPAIEVELKGKDGALQEKFWVFARYPDMHQSKTDKFNFIYNWVGRRPKDFISKVTVIKNGRKMISRDIRVNFPLKFEGYAFFQASYDTEGLNWTGLKVVNDPGVGIVYLGFILFILGLSIRFYISPFMRISQK